MQPSSAAKSPELRGGSRGGAPTSPTPKTTTTDAFGFPPNRAAQNYATSPNAERRSVDRFGQSYMTANEGDRASESADPTTPQTPTLLLRRLPANMNQEALASLLLFAEDLLDARLASHEYPDDRGFVTAVARFRTFEGALEVRNKLHGKSNASRDATIVVEILQGGNTTPNEVRRRSSDAHPRQLSPSASSGASSGGAGGRQSRFNKTFQSLDRMSPTRRSQGHNNIEMPNSDVNSHLQSIFSPQSPIGTSYGDRTRITGKSVIGDDSVDDETGELLKDPLAYAKSGQMDSGQWQPRNSNLPISRLANLKLDTTNDAFSDSTNSMMSPPGYGSSRHAAMSMKSPGSEFSPNGMSNGMPAMSPPGNYPISPQHYQRHQYPPANPADQNPPCNTLYVGNLPIDTSEDELKAMFSKQRGYKRLCFRTKHNGPMCFVEFEDISFATKALNELYGHPLHNSVKGGIRLSFSKNPLGVRTGQGNGMGPVSPLTSPTASGFGNIGCPPGFSTANGPPPGLPMPVGGGSTSSSSNANTHTASFFSPGSPPLSSQSNHSGFRHPSISGGFGGPAAGGGMHSIGTGFSEYPLGR